MELLLCSLFKKKNDIVLVTLIIIGHISYTYEYYGYFFPCLGNMQADSEKHKWPFIYAYWIKDTISSAVRVNILGVNNTPSSKIALGNSFKKNWPWWFYKVKEFKELFSYFFFFKLFHVISILGPYQSTASCHPGWKSLVQCS